MRTSHRRLRIEIEQTKVRVQWGDGEMPPDGGRQMVSDLLAASEKLLDQDAKGNAVRQDADSGPRNDGL